MKEVNRIINECNLSKVKVAKYLGVSRQMLYNYLSFDDVNDLPNDKKGKIFKLFNVTKEEELTKIKVDNKFLEEVDARLNEGLVDNLKEANITDLKGLNKKEQELLSDIFQLLKDRLLEEERKDKAYSTIKYLYYFLQSMDQIEELKYILAHFAKYNGLIKPLEFIFNEDKQYMFEGILYSAMTLYTNGNPSKSKVSESHKRFEADIESKKEEQLSRTQELNTFKQLALQELGYASITEANAKEVFEKIAEIMSRKF